MKEIKKILIVEVNWLGDVLFTTPAIKAIKKAYPNCHLACMILPRVREVLEGNPNVDELIIFDEKGKHLRIAPRIKFILELRRKRFDIVFLFHRSLTRTLITFFAGIPKRVGYATRKRGFLLTKRIPQPPEGMHRSDSFSNIAESFGIIVKDRNYEFFVSEKSRFFIREFLEKEGISPHDFLVVINPGANWSLKRWPKENFAEVSDRLIEYFNAKIVISGGDKDIDLAIDISNMMKAKPIILTGKTTFKQLGALIERANLVISADSGPMHLAAAVGKNLIALFGPTDPKITGPRGKANTIIMQKDVSCKIPCYELDCRDNLCMEAISVEDVLLEVRKIRR
ncbi:MAG: lipopolysaccharide heptosyltransferase II [Candidatus Omnitrophota bacterium]|nr:lipopolysaccharide heptosyltransferase II [Candidatus Omnitrophota bacterium]